VISTWYQVLLPVVKEKSRRHSCKHSPCFHISHLATTFLIAINR